MDRSCCSPRAPEGRPDRAGDQKRARRSRSRPGKEIHAASGGNQRDGKEVSWLEHAREVNLESGKQRRIEFLPDAVGSGGGVDRFCEAEDRNLLHSRRGKDVGLLLSYW